MSIYKKLFEAKKQIGKITKDSKNPFFKSNYLSLNGLIDAVDEVLEDNGLIMLQPIEDGKVKTQIFDIEEGRTSIIQSEMTLPNIQDPQKLGSAITYFRRYTLQSLLGLQAEDDDGNSSTKQVKEERKEALTIEKFEKAKTFTKEQIKTALNNYRMTPIQRTELTKLTV
jgi:hypothetical protein